MDFNNPLNWDLALRNNYIVSQLPDPNKYIPIPPIFVTVTSPVLAIGAKSETAMPHWYLAASAYQRLQFSPSSTSNFNTGVVSNEGIKVRLNTLNLIQFPNFLDAYNLEIRIPYWIEDLYLEVWNYSGDLLNSVDYEIIEVQYQLNRIETKVDLLYAE